MFVSLARVCIVYVVKEVTPCAFTIHTCTCMYNTLSSLSYKAISIIVYTTMCM